MVRNSVAAIAVLLCVWLMMAGSAHAGNHPYLLRLSPDGVQFDRVMVTQTDPLLRSLRYQAYTSQGLAFQTAGIRDQQADHGATRITFNLDGPQAAQASVTVLVTSLAGGVRLRWTIHDGGPAQEINGGKTGFQMEYPQPILSADTVPATRFVRPTGALPYEVKGDTPYRDLEWQLRQVCFARSRLVIATNWYDPDWIYGGNTARAAFLPAPFPKSSPADAVYDFALVPLAAADPGILTPGVAADVAAAASGRAFSLSVLCPRPANLFVPGETARFTLRLRNVADARQTGLLHWKVWDYYGKALAGGTEPVTLAPGAEKAFPVAIPHARRGMLFLAASLTANGQEWIDRTTFGVLPKRPLDSRRPPSPFGLAGIICNQDTYPDQKSPAQVLALAHRMGARWVRLGFPLASASENTTAPDPQAQAWQTLLASEGLSCHLQIHTGLPAPGQAEEFKVQVRTTLQRLSGLSSNIEFGNELNLAGVTPQDYVDRLLRPVHDVTREVLPQSKILTMGLGGVDKTWLDGLAAAGGLGLADVLSIHPGCQPRAPEYWKGYRGWVFRPQVLDAQAAAQAAGSNDVWLTETYAPTPPERSQLDVRTAGDYMVRTFLVSLALGIPRIEWYQLQDGVWFAQRPNPADTEYNYGLVYTDLTPKPGYLAYAAMTEQLEGNDYQGRLELGTDDLYGLRFRRGSGRVDVLWSYREKHETDLDWWPPEKFQHSSRQPGEPWKNRWHSPISVRLPASSPVTVTDIMGNSQTLTPHTGFVTLPLTGSPVYVQGLGTIPTRKNLW